MTSPEERNQEPNAQWAGAAVIVTITASLLTTGFLFYLQRPPPLPRCRYESLSIAQTTFSNSTAGEVNFHLNNDSGCDVTIVQATVVGAGIVGTVSANVNSTILASASLSLTVIFSNTNFQQGARYDFTLISSHWNKFPFSAVR